MNKLTKVETLYVPRDENDTALVHYTKKVYDTSPNGFKLISDVKKEENKYILSEEELRAEIKRAFIHGQGNAQMIEAGLERDEVEDYVNYRMLQTK